VAGGQLIQKLINLKEGLKDLTYITKQQGFNSGHSQHVSGAT
jgi:hypothetical protein